MPSLCYILTFVLCLLEETLKAGGPFYLVSMPGEVNDLTCKCVTCSGLTNSRECVSTSSGCLEVNDLTQDTKLSYAP